MVTVFWDNRNPTGSDLLSRKNWAVYNCMPSCAINIVVVKDSSIAFSFIRSDPQQTDVVKRKPHGKSRSNNLR